MNGRCFPYTTPLEVCCGENIRIRLANSSDQAHPIHIHGHRHQFMIAASDGNMIPLDRRIVKNTIRILFNLNNALLRYSHPVGITA